jgi:hypothetical protein
MLDNNLKENMYTKNIKVTNIFVLSLLVLAASISAGFYFSQPQSVALANSEPVQQISLENRADAVRQQGAGKQVLLKTQNDISVEITSTRLISTGVEIGVCYTVPDSGEWRPMPGHLFYGEYDIYPDEIEFLPKENLADGKNTGTRCALIRYRVDDLDAVHAPVEFSIIQFYAPGREMYSPCQEFLQRLGTNPKAQDLGLKAKCAEVGDGNISVTLIDHDKTVAKDKASKLLYEIAEGKVVGPWEFTITEIGN